MNKIYHMRTEELEKLIKGAFMAGVQSAIDNINTDNLCTAEEHTAMFWFKEFSNIRKDLELEIARHV